MILYYVFRAFVLVYEANKVVPLGPFYPCDF